MRIMAFVSPEVGAYVANETRIDPNDALECIVPLIAGFSTEPRHLDRGGGVR